MIEAARASEATSAIELTILMPCLNEAETIGSCIAKAQSFLQRANVVGELLVADNGSNDGSQGIAESLGARVVPIASQGYGAALIGGIAAARGRYIVMGDADDSYDFANLDSFVDALRGGADLVMGNRFKGGIQPGAMPFLHRFFGNPVLSFLGRLLFRVPIGDFHCGLRGFEPIACELWNCRRPGWSSPARWSYAAPLLSIELRKSRPRWSRTAAAGLPT